ncbi:MAG: hypothetical protein AMXMBFR53_36740 [Gemmatimonadota bacterium]
MIAIVAFLAGAFLAGLFRFVGAMAAYDAGYDAGRERAARDFDPDAFAMQMREDATAFRTSNRRPAA